MTDFGLSQFILDDIVEIVGRYPQVKSAGIYGSRAKGSYKNYSDIDLAIHAPAIASEDYARLYFELSELPLAFKIDIVHVDTLGNQDLAEKIKKEEKQIYPAKVE